MKRLLLLALMLALFPPGQPVSARAAESNEEQQLIAVLHSDSSLTKKDAACARLKRIGTDQSVTALTALLADEQLSHSARYALESMPSAKAGQALADALAKTSGLTKVGIINSLGFRGEERAVPALATLLADQNPLVAVAAATALGQIATTKALKALQDATPSSAGPVHTAIVDAWLRGAYHHLAAGSKSKALGIFQALYDTEKADTVRTAAYRGMILASGNKAPALMVSAILGNDGASQIAALQLVREVDAPDATKTFVVLLQKVNPPVQVALIEGLSQRGDVSAAPVISTMATSASPEVRVATIKALGVLGDATMVPLLGVAATSANGEEQSAARLALIQLRRGNPTERLLRLLPDAKPAVQAEFARALGDRGDRAAVPRLEELAREGSGTATKAALQALALLVDDAQLGVMVQFVIDAKSEAGRADAAEALNSACHQTQTRRGRVNVEPLLQGLASAPAGARIALLPVCCGLIDPRLRTALRAALADPDAQVRTAASRALCDTTDAELLPDVLKVACSAREENLRTLAIRACVRLTTQEESIKLSVKDQVGPLKAILATPLHPEQKRLVLAGLAEIPDLEALKLAEPMLNEAGIQLEAAKATTKIACALPFAQAESVEAALKKVLTATTDADTRNTAEAALKDIQAGADYIGAWQVAGPYSQEGKEYSQLFDIVLPPETANTEGVKWQAAPPGLDARHPWILDLLKAFGGEQRVAYARTWVHCDQQKPVLLELGTDDGVKVWLNGNVVHTNNTFRGIQPGTDKVNVTLKAGWNPLLLKVTQLNQGWAFCACLRNPDGTHLDGLKFSSQPPER
jgi:HEAT repeat protein